MGGSSIFADPSLDNLGVLVSEEHLARDFAAVDVQPLTDAHVPVLPSCEPPGDVPQSEITPRYEPLVCAAARELAERSVVRETVVTPRFVLAARARRARAQRKKELRAIVSKSKVKLDDVMAQVEGNKVMQRKQELRALDETLEAMAAAETRDALNEHYAIAQKRATPLGETVRVRALYQRHESRIRAAERQRETRELQERKEAEERRAAERMRLNIVPQWVGRCALTGECKCEESPGVVLDTEDHMTLECSTGCKLFFHDACYRIFKKRHKLRAATMACTTPACDGTFVFVSDVANATARRHRLDGADAVLEAIRTRKAERREHARLEEERARAERRAVRHARQLARRKERQQMQAKKEREEKRARAQERADRAAERQRAERQRVDIVVTKHAPMPQVTVTGTSASSSSSRGFSHSGKRLYLTWPPGELKIEHIVTQLRVSLNTIVHKSENLRPGCGYVELDDEYVVQSFLDDPYLLQTVRGTTVAKFRTRDEAVKAAQSSQAVAERERERERQREREREREQRERDSQKRARAPSSSPPSSSPPAARTATTLAEWSGEATAQPQQAPTPEEFPGLGGGRGGASASTSANNSSGSAAGVSAAAVVRLSTGGSIASASASTSASASPSASVVPSEADRERAETAERERLIDRLASMGFLRTHAVVALVEARGNLETAVELCLAGIDVGHSGASAPSSTAGSTAGTPTTMSSERVALERERREREEAERVAWEVQRAEMESLAANVSRVESAAGEWGGTDALVSMLEAAEAEQDVTALPTTKKSKKNKKKKKKKKQQQQQQQQQAVVVSAPSEEVNAAAAADLKKKRAELERMKQEQAELAKQVKRQRMELRMKRDEVETQRSTLRAEIAALKEKMEAPPGKKKAVTKKVRGLRRLVFGSDEMEAEAQRAAAAKREAASAVHECPICCETTDDGVEMMVLPCTHEICMSCLSRWRRESITKSKSLDCPACRTPFKFSAVRRLV